MKMIPGIASLAGFSYLLTLIDSSAAGVCRVWRRLNHGIGVLVVGGGTYTVRSLGCRGA